MYMNISTPPTLHFIVWSILKEKLKWNFQADLLPRQITFSLHLYDLKSISKLLLCALYLFSFYGLKMHSYIIYLYCFCVNLRGLLIKMVVDLIKSFISLQLYGVRGSSIYHWQGIKIIFSTIYTMLPFDICI